MGDDFRLQNAEEAHCRLMSPGAPLSRVPCGSFRNQGTVI